MHPIRKSLPRMLVASKATILEKFFGGYHLEFNRILHWMPRGRSINLSVYLVFDLETGRFKLTVNSRWKVFSWGNSLFCRPQYVFKNRKGFKTITLPNKLHSQHLTFQWKLSVFSSFWETFIPWISLSCLILHAKSSTAKTKRKGDNRHPCSTPLESAK